MIAESVRFHDLLRAVDGMSPGVLTAPEDLPDLPVFGLTQDSRNVSPGDLFCAIEGGVVDGHEFVETAIDAGAVAVVVQRPTTERVPELLADDSRSATGYLASALAGQPTKHLDLVGVTGTNGKTSVVTLVAHIVERCGGTAAAMGTLTGSLTTAAAPEFQQTVSEHLDRGCSVVAAEISSHALDQKRVVGSDVSVAVFTNLSQDHLDYHHDMQTYFEAKAELFGPEYGASAVVNVSDPWGALLAERIEQHRSAGQLRPDHRLVEVDCAAIIGGANLSPRSSHFKWRGRSITMPLGGSFSVANAALAAEAAAMLGYDEDAIALALHNAAPIPGRFESIDHGQPFTVVVDYSHTPASVTAAIESARKVARGRVIIVFGAAGDRDPGKRPLMGAAATDADVLYVTSDNPRTEDPEEIIDAVLVGVGDHEGNARVVNRVADRAKAIRSAIREAESDDIVVIAGKGHEDYQIVGSTRRDFDDREYARGALVSLGWEGTP